VQPAEQIIVLTIGPRQERSEMSEADPFEAPDPLETLERARVLRTDAIDQDLVELTYLARADHREGQHVPEWEAEIVDQHLAPRLGAPFSRIERGQELVDVPGRCIEVDLPGEPLDQLVELAELAFHERLGVVVQVLDLVR